MGAWIETFSYTFTCVGAKVAPYVGAWIETKYVTKDLDFYASHPTWVRGLKPVALCHYLYKHLSHPTWVRGLKLDESVNYVQFCEVAPYVGAWIETS